MIKCKTITHLNTSVWHKSTTTGSTSMNVYVQTVLVITLLTCGQADTEQKGENCCLCILLLKYCISWRNISAVGTDYILQKFTQTKTNVAPRTSPLCHVHVKFCLLLLLLFGELVTGGSVVAEAVFHAGVWRQLPFISSMRLFPISAALSSPIRIGCTFNESSWLKVCC